jgi:hypothetical protein
MKYILFALSCIVLVTILTWFTTPDHSVDLETRRLCREYANRDHEKEIAPPRYLWLGRDFVNNYDWYNSCLNHSRYPVMINYK